LASNKDVKSAAGAVVAAFEGLAPENQAEVAALELIAPTAEAADKDRGIYIQAIALILIGAQAEQAVRVFITTLLSELVCDVPKLPEILKTELIPALAFSSEAREKLLNEIDSQTISN